MKRSELKNLSKDQLIDMLAEPETHDVTIELTMNPKEPDIMYWYWNGGMSGCDDVEDFLKNVFPRYVREEIKTAEFILGTGDDEVPY